MTHTERQVSDTTGAPGEGGPLDEPDRVRARARAPTGPAESIASFYSGRSILVTGSTGFIGKVLIEKLLHSCPDIGRVYLLIRAARGRTPEARLADMIGERPFNIRLKREFCERKLVAVESDLASSGLGLTAERRTELARDVSIVFHVAASVKFEAPLEVNMRHNVVATKELLDLASSFTQLACFMHVSTAYSNCQLLQIEERVYPMHLPEDPMALEVTKEMLENRPNTYTFTKALAENVAQSYADRINVVIVRPSIVMSAIREPTEGWVDTINGPVGLSVLGALGILQKIKVNSEVVFDLIPVDIVSNALVTIGWAATEHREQFSASVALASGRANTDAGAGAPELGSTPQTGDKSSSNKNNNQNHNHNNNNNTIISNNKHGQVPGTSAATATVFNLTTGSENPCSFYHYFSTGREEAYKKPTSRALRPLLSIPKQKGMNSVQYWIHKVFSHLLFAYLVDFLLGLFQQKRMVVKAVKKMHHANEMFDYFCSNQWQFSTDNVKRMRELQSPADKYNFNCDVRSINWDTYAKIGWLGCRRFILKEPDSTMAQAKRRYRLVCYLYYSTKLLFIATLTGLASMTLSSTPAVWLTLMPLYGIVYLL